MQHPQQAGTSYLCDGCGHHASFHGMEGREEEEVVGRWKAEAEAERGGGGGVVGGGEKERGRGGVMGGGGGEGGGGEGVEGVEEGEEGEVAVMGGRKRKVRG